ncbi:MAG: TatD family hydrolase [Candidatus Cloacimonetes bacterium]|nr:TatD family hydrolase [Candidatus Cloacimonadota bacterium]
MKIFETHAHLNFKDFNKDREQLLKKCKASGIEYVINIGVDEKTSKNSIDLAKKYDFIYATVGYHPHDAKKFDEKIIRELAKHKKVVAIGEIGLDYYRNLSPKEIQIQVFKKQLEIALDLNLPVVIHDREAHEDCFDILNKYKIKKVVFHCFSGDEIFAEKVIDKGWFISFTGIITYKNSIMENIVRIVPENKFFVETDSPYLSPVPFRGKRNSPLNLRYIIEKISEVKQISPKKVADLSFNNAIDFFNIN